MNRFYIYLLLIFYSSSVRGQDVSVKAIFDTSTIYIGDQLNFTIRTEKPSGLKLTMPFFKDSIIKNIEILSGPVVDSSVQNGRTTIIEKYIVTSFDSGFYEIPPVFAEIRNEAGVKRFYSDYTALHVLRVTEAPADTTAQFYDIIQPYDAPVTISEIIPWALLGVIILVLAWFALKYMRKPKKPEKVIETIVNPDPAHVIAFRELEQLKEEQLWQKGETKKYYSKLTEILRRYLENRYKVFSLELTTSETLEALVRTGFKKDTLYNLLKSVLTGADLVKFAKYKPDIAENETHFLSSWDFVDATKAEEVANVVISNYNKREDGK